MASNVISTVLNLKDNFSETIKNTARSVNSFAQQIADTEGKSKKMESSVTSAFGSMGDAIKEGIGIGAGLTIFETAKNGMLEMVTFGSSLQDALNGVQVSTGTTTDAMTGMKDVMTSIYSDNYGDSFADIGESLSIVSQQTHTTGDDLKELTENALQLKESFGMDTSESIRAVSTLMKQFGITGDDAFNLIAQGKQKGLDFSGEMLDSINEYSVQFSKVGLGAEDMFNVFANGSASGAFNVDKIGDSVKEFSIRAIDGSDTTIDGFTKLGFSADDMASKFGQGGDTAKQAFKETIEALKKMDNPVQQSIVGVDLFGTQFEDLGISAVSSLSDVDGGISLTNDALGSISSSSHFEDIGSAFEGVKRSLQTDLILPISNEVLPAVNELVTWFVSKIPDIKATIEGLAPSFITIRDVVQEITSVATIAYDFITTNWAEIAPVIVTITSAIVAWKVAIIAVNTWAAVVSVTTAVWGTIELMVWGVVNATTAWEAVQWLLNVAMDANPIGVVIMLITAIGLAIYEVITHWQDICTWITTTWDMLKNNPIAEFILATNPFTAVLFQIAKHWDDIVSAVSKAWDWLQKWIGTDVPEKDVTVNQQVNTTGGGTTFDDNGNLNFSNPALAVGTNTNATGTDYWKGGFTTLNEHGDEAVYLPTGSKVKTATQTKNALNGNGGGAININFNNCVGTEELFNQAGEYIAQKIKIGLLNQ